MFTEKKFQDVALVTVAWLMKGNEGMKKQLDHLSNYTRRENIHIIGLPESVEMLKPADFVCMSSVTFLALMPLKCLLLLTASTKPTHKNHQLTPSPDHFWFACTATEYANWCCVSPAVTRGQFYTEASGFTFSLDVSLEVARLRSSFTGVKPARFSCGITRR